MIKLFGIKFYMVCQVNVSTLSGLMFFIVYLKILQHLVDLKIGFVDLLRIYIDIIQYL